MCSFLLMPKVEGKSKDDDGNNNEKREAKKQHEIRMARKCSLTMTPSQNIMCIVSFSLLLFGYLPILHVYLIFFSLNCTRSSVVRKLL